MTERVMFLLCLMVLVKLFLVLQSQKKKIKKKKSGDLSMKQFITSDNNVCLFTNHILSNLHKLCTFKNCMNLYKIVVNHSSNEMKRIEQV
jgi:hypothetical protein